jgi:phage gp36-like protein
MAYATAQDLIDRYGATEIARLSAADGASVVAVDAVRCAMALDDATALVESYLRARYQLPLSPVPREILAATCALARHQLAQGGGREPSDQIKAARDETIAWLKALSSGSAQIEGARPIGEGREGARTSDRERPLPTGSFPGFV